ncbi:uncharacterized protein LOC141881586 [Acropora palmata]|uniref:uncharacterized protein LOC141881586 n=1 Tax=Acropora palmata TaxID=6131 RepID=UPI003DA01240
MADKFAIGIIFVVFISVGQILAITRLEPEKTLSNQVLYHQETAIYHLVQLKPGRRYELRVSYDATTPTDFCIHLMSKDALGTFTRRLLNIEKIVFDNQKTVVEQFANVTAIRTGVPLQPASLTNPVVYNIVLEELFMGIPWQVWKLAVIVLLISFFIVKYLVPHALKFIDVSVLKIHKER